MSTPADIEAPPLRVCKKCGEVKPLEAFRKKGPYRYHTCKACHCARVTARLYYPKQRPQAKWRASGMTPEQVAAKRLYYREKRLRLGTKPYRPDPVKNRARQLLARAVRAGRIVRPGRCQSCNQLGLIQAHHPDYSRPYDVEWLCSICHGMRHQQDLGVVAGSENLLALDTETGR